MSETLRMSESELKEWSADVRELLPHCMQPTLMGPGNKAMSTGDRVHFAMLLADDIALGRRARKAPSKRLTATAPVKGGGNG